MPVTNFKAFVAATFLFPSLLAWLASLNSAITNLATGRCLRLAGSATPPIATQLSVAVDSDWSVWLYNLNDHGVDCEAGELFGFNLGSFSEKAVGAVVFAFHAL